MVRNVLAALGATLLVVAWPAAAWAHVTVQPGEAAKGSFTEISFRVPNERDDASTTELRVQLPADHPIAFVSTKPLDGWTATTKTETLAEPIKTDDGEITEAVTEVTWTGGEVAPGQYQDFSISAGPLPDDVDELVFKAIQVYDDGEEVPWIDEPLADGSEPEHPAPTLQLTAATGDEHGAGGSESDGGDEQASATVIASLQDEVDDANSRATIGVVVGAIGIIVGVAAIVLARRRTT